MDDRSQQLSTGTIGGQTQDPSQFQLPTTPSTPATFGAPENTDTPRSEFQPAGWLLAKRPGTAWGNAIPQPLHREHVHLSHTPFAEIVAFHPDHPGSLATGELQLHPRGTEFAVAVTNGGPDEDGKSLLGFSQKTGRCQVHTLVSGPGVPERSLIVEGTEMVLRPVVGILPSQTHNLSQQPSLQSGVFPSIAERFNGSPRRRVPRYGGGSLE
jgi:hypothetical protein